MFNDLFFLSPMSRKQQQQQQQLQQQQQHHQHQEQPHQPPHNEAQMVLGVICVLIAN